MKITARISEAGAHAKSLGQTPTAVYLGVKQWCEFDEETRSIMTAPTDGFPIKKWDGLEIIAVMQMDHFRIY